MTQITKQEDEKGAEPVTERRSVDSREEQFRRRVRISRKAAAAAVSCAATRRVPRVCR